MRHSVYVLAFLSVTWLACRKATAQEIVHALSGTFQHVDPQSKTIQVATNDGSEGTFSFQSHSGTTEIAFERDVQDRVTPAASFDKAKEPVIVYYYGDGALRTAVGVQDLGPGPLDIVEGVVTRLERRHQQISIRDSSGTERTFPIDPKAMADSPAGAVPANRLSAAKGDHVRVIATKTTGAETALFIHD